MKIVAANVKSRKYGGKSLAVDLIEKNKVMVPKKIQIDGEGVTVKNFDLGKLRKNRKERYSDSRNFS